MAKKGEWTPAGGGQIYGRGPSNRAPSPGVAPGTGGSTATPEVFQPRPTPPAASPSQDQPQPGQGNVDNGGGGGGGYSYSPPPPPPPPRPVLPVFKEDTSSTFKNVKIASKDIIVFDESDVNIELMQDLLFEDIAAIELANISRYDLIDGQEVFYSPIKNLSTIKRRFDPNNIIATAINNKTSYAINLTSRIGSGTYQGVTKGVPVLGLSDEIYFYIDNLKEGEIVEIQLISSGTISEIGEQ